ncbi:hypothetical protein ACFQVD_07110 [Streptosporangium amethystogenes subsp. fukuiense]|uniref:Uncharacterized protein n=1 Tax=Streptosporangium amethystogenes subsp. fukuiense TaxID=698418 RepID=A0ABW2SU76_9ACTN
MFGWAAATRAHGGFPAPASVQPPAGDGAPPASIVVATLYHRDRPFDDAFADFFDRSVRPVMTEAGEHPAVVAL